MSSIATFFYQGGYAFFVWGAYGMGVLLLSAEMLFLRQRRTAQLATIRRLLRRRAQESKHESPQ